MSATPMSAGESQTGSLIPSEFYFITAPQDIHWDKKSKLREIETYGSNAPYVSYGSTGLRHLTLNDCMLEGFSNAQQVESFCRHLLS